MCGIVGIFDMNGIDKNLLKSMSSELTHRGPDDEGFFFDRNVGLANRRLSIVDVPGGKQPIHNETEDVWIVYNGEIYNYKELMNDLEKKGHKFYTRSDTEVIVHAYEEWGHDCVKRLIGMFAFAVWDSKKKELFLARDYVGIKPLYYYHNGDRFVFASEIKAILVDDSVERKIDDVALGDYLSFRFVPAERTMFAGIRKLPAAHYMVFKDGSLRVKKYWDVDFTNSDSDAKDFRKLFSETVHSYLIGEVPMGVFLSGGLDSSAITALMKEVKDEVETFSVGFDLEGFNEFAYSDLVAEQFNTKHHKFVLDHGTFADSLPEIVWHFDEPMADPASIPLYHLSKYAKKHVTVLLSGEGSDELFAGYSSFRLNRQLMKISKLKGSKLGQVLKGIGYRFPDIAYLNSLVKSVSLPYDEFFVEISTTYGRRDKEEILKSGVWKRLKTEDGKILMRHLHAKDTSELNKILYSALKLLQDGLMMKADKMTMAASVEARVPFLDKNVIEFSAALPDNMKIRKFSGKHILKESMRGLLPKEIIDRKKLGFPVPIDSIIMKDMKDVIRSVILNGSVTDKHFRRSKIKNMLNAHFSGKQNLGSQIFTLFMLELWNKIYIEQSCVKDSKISDFTRLAQA